MDIQFNKIFKDKGYYDSEVNEIKRVDLLLNALKCQKELLNDNSNNNNHVYCTDCINFRLDDEELPYCCYEDKCDINDCDDSKAYSSGLRSLSEII